MKVEINIFVCVITPIWLCEVFVREPVRVRVRACLIYISAMCRTYQNVSLTQKTHRHQAGEARVGRHLSDIILTTFDTSASAANLYRLLVRHSLLSLPRGTECGVGCIDSLQ